MTGGTPDLGAHTDELAARLDAAEAALGDLRQRSVEELGGLVHAAAHELVEPLWLARGFTELARRRYGEASREELLDHLERVLAAVDRMQGLVDGLGTYARIVTRLEPFEEVDLSAVLDDVVVRELERASPGPVVDVGPLPIVLGDPEQLADLFHHLLRNAVTFVAAGTTPVVRVSAAVAGEARWQVSVADNGIGIDARARERVFGLFERLHPRGRYPGTGIGLAVARKVVERHGGEIWIEERPGGGTRVCLTLAGSTA